MHDRKFGGRSRNTSDLTHVLPPEGCQTEVGIRPRLQTDQSAEAEPQITYEVGLS